MHCVTRYAVIAILLYPTCTVADETIDALFEHRDWTDFKSYAVPIAQNDHAARMVPSIIDLLKSSDCWTVQRAKFLLIAYDRKAVPALIRLLDGRQRVKLRDTADFWYIDGGESVGHGIYAPYRLDLIAVRAGWVLEELTFCDFGFSEPWRDDQADDTEIESNLHAAKENVSKWCGRFDEWNRLCGLRDALRSHSKTRQLAALQWLRRREPPIDGFDDSYMERELKLFVETLAAGTGEVKVIATHVLKGN